MENKIKSQKEIIKELEDKIAANMEEIKKVFGGPLSADDLVSLLAVFSALDYVCRDTARS